MSASRTAGLPNVPKGSVPDFVNSEMDPDAFDTPGTAGPARDAAVPPARRFLAAAILCAGLTGTSFADASETPAGRDVFTDGAVHGFVIELTPGSRRQLSEEPRRFVRSVVRSGPDTFSNVALRLKGSTGSFRGLDDKPAFTLDFERFNPGQRFHGLSRIYLNNSVEDPSLLHELLGAELFRAAGVPAPRITHARVELGGRRLGLYVLKEGFTRGFLATHFTRNDGALYDNDAGCDVDQPMNRNLGDDPEPARPGLAAAATAAAEPDLARRWMALERTLDMDRFITFMVMEVMLGHRDGYCCGRNNFRIYHDPGLDQLVFLPDGMDQLFGLADFTWCPRMSGLLASAVLETREGRERYRERFTELLERVFVASMVTSRVDEVVDRLRPGLSRSEFREVAHEAAALQARIVQRRLCLEAQLRRPDSVALVLQGDEARLESWFETDAASAAQIAEAAGADGRPTLRIVAGNRTSAAWRTRVVLGPGRYRFEGQVMVAEVQPLAFGHQQGAALRVAGLPWVGSRLTGDSGWRTLSAEFEIRDTAREVELLCELRARGGQMWVDRHSLRLVRLTPGKT